MTAKDGRWYSARVMPYRTMDDKIDGVVITFTDITLGKNSKPNCGGSTST